jgi:ABC-type uncharacterized transport system substrate-binding protein
MARRWRPALVLLLLAAAAAGAVLVATRTWRPHSPDLHLPPPSDAGPYRLEPLTRDGHPWRIGYLQGGDWPDYAGHLRGFARGLMELGWLPPLELPKGQGAGETAGLWRRLSEETSRQYLHFVGDAFYDAQWDPKRRIAVRRELLRRLTEREDLDLVIAAGTWAGQDLATDVISTPVVVISTSDPVGAGIIDSAADSGHDHLHAMCDPDRYIRQIRAFHSLVQFRRLGVVYEDTPDGRAWSNVGDLEAVAAERGFTLVHRHLPDPGAPPPAPLPEVVRLYEELAPRIDALWIGAHAAQTARSMPAILQPLLEKKVAVWAQDGPPAVRRGALLSISERDLDEVGLFYAKVAATALHGVPPRAIGQVYEDPKRLAINLATARRIDFRVPPGALAVAGDVYESIEDASQP